MISSTSNTLGFIADVITIVTFIGSISYGGWKLHQWVKRHMKLDMTFTVKLSAGSDKDTKQ
ncbi:hypothetical protein MD588_00905 [Photobacterium sp. SDRW27]|uniref:hypothetical protein n=1 Tax=Photobacterium obscurum TaxID=2829490 RepID=UPI0022441177|nr:hypothetical protein [Photobacterium obscurum]MCW8327359.1 hypothetical protein [Photobacterium obscurum]